MGPSGCGKSTLLNTLCGKATYGKRVGRVLFNTKQREITAYRQVIGFVPQVRLSPSLPDSAPMSMRK